MENVTVTMKIYGERNGTACAYAKSGYPVLLSDFTEHLGTRLTHTHTHPHPPTHQPTHTQLLNLNRILTFSCMSMMDGFSPKTVQQLLVRYAGAILLVSKSRIPLQ